MCSFFFLALHCYYWIWHEFSSSENSIYFQFRLFFMAFTKINRNILHTSQQLCTTQTTPFDFIMVCERARSIIISTQKEIVIDIESCICWFNKFFHRFLFIFARVFFLLSQFLIKIWDIQKSMHIFEQNSLRKKNCRALYVSITDFLPIALLL